jgi:hypothetical protein
MPNYLEHTPSTIVIIAKRTSIQLQIDVKYIDNSYIIDETFSAAQPNEVTCSLLLTFVRPCFK